MLNKKDYAEYFNEIYKVELAMKKEGQKLLKMTDNQEAKDLLKELVQDEIRHSKIVLEMKELIR